MLRIYGPNQTNSDQCHHGGFTIFILVFKKRPKYEDYPTFGSPCEIVTCQQDKLVSTSKTGFFVGKGNNTGAFLVWSPHNPYKIIRAHHIRVNEGSIGNLFDGMFTKSDGDDPRPKESSIDLIKRKFIHMTSSHLPMKGHLD